MSSSSSSPIMPVEAAAGAATPLSLSKPLFSSFVNSLASLSCKSARNQTQTSAKGQGFSVEHVLKTNFYVEGMMPTLRNVLPLAKCCIILLPSSDDLVRNVILRLGLGCCCTLGSPEGVIQC